MKLEDFLNQYNIRPKTFARNCGLNPNTIRDAIKGYEINYNSMETIIKFTWGKVKFEDLKPTQKRVRKATKSDNLPEEVDSRKPHAHHKSGPEQNSNPESVNRHS